MSILFYRHVIFNIAYPVFLKEILLISTNPLSKVNNFAIRVEFQIKRSPHVRSFFWVLSHPVLSESITDSFTEYLDTSVSANLPCKQRDLKLFNLVKKYQIFLHSITYK